MPDSTLNPYPMTSPQPTFHGGSNQSSDLAKVPGWYVDPFGSGQALVEWPGLDRPRRHARTRPSGVPADLLVVLHRVGVRRRANGFPRRANPVVESLT